MDNVIADFERQIIDTWIKKHPDLPYVKLEDRNTFYGIKQYPEEHHDLVKAIYFEEGFYRNMKPIEGALDAAKDLAKDHKVFICTSPMTSSQYCTAEKFQWVEYHLGKEWKNKTIITKDKTMIIGDYLIDDKPEVAGAEEPIWEHIIFDWPWNQHIKNKKRIIKWQNYREVLGI